VTSKSKELGNTQTGDGRRFKGRGPIQLTGRANYKRYGDLLGVDLISDPTRAATPQVGFRTAGLFWKRNGLNELADKQWFKTITKRINGGFNGLPERTRYYVRAKAVLMGGGRGVSATADDLAIEELPLEENDFAPEDTGEDQAARDGLFARGSENPE
jgi:hypothetical protein